MQILSSCNGVNNSANESTFTEERLTLFKVNFARGEFGFTASTMALTCWSVRSLAARLTSLLLATTCASRLAGTFL